ncbi:hypothetical protein KC992_00820 [Candidatus Saccharibacteria bacterium]|nr:hypothetical protein [Candidatus Saccharibacteria bacterium]MCA9328196.1 hypothetical protein [Candidatus Saccharibacteria bacterium]
MSNGVIAFMFAVGVTVWVYAKFQKRTGSNTQKAVGGAVVVGVISFIVFLTLMWSIS